MTPAFYSNSRRFIAHFVFWTWNTLFAIVTYFGLLPVLFSELGDEIPDLPSSFLVCIVAAVVVPTAALLVGALRLRDQPAKLLQLFFAVEAPVLLASVFRIFVVRELSGPAAILMGALFIGTTAQAFLIVTDITRFGGSIRLGVHLAQTIGVAVAAYVAVLLAIFVPPAAVGIFDAVVQGDFFDAIVRSFRHEPILFFAVLTAGASCVLSLVLPIAFIASHTKGFVESLRSFGGRARRLAVLALSVVTVVAGLGLARLITVDTRPTLDRLATVPADNVERSARIDDAERIHDDLVATYLWRYRFMSATSDVNIVEGFYRTNMPSTRDGTAEAAQTLFNQIAAPFLYEGSFGDIEVARSHYAAFFDESIQRGARDEIKHALRATFERTDVPANLLDVGERAVHLVEQTVTVNPRDVGAEIEIFDVYENKTNDDVEVLYYFSLPDTAVVTGLWLSDVEKEREKAFRFRVSPRGAAQRTYEGEVRRRIDPALIEQIGPRQYRLRAFPVPGQPRRRFAGDEEGPRRLYLWLTYQALPENGVWPLPAVREARNVFWDGHTIRHVDGEKTAGTDAWSERTIRTEQQRDLRTLVHPVGDNLAVVATPTENEPTIPRGGRRYALVVDRSYSMNKNREALQSTLDWLRATVYPESAVDLYLTSSGVRGEGPVLVQDEFSYDVTRELFYGAQSTASMLAQTFALAADADITCPIGHRGIECYDAVILLTDAGSIEIEEDATLDWSAQIPLWIVHVGGELALGYADAVTQAVQRSGGAVATDVREVFAALARAERTDEAFIGFGGGYTWTLEPFEAHAPDEARAEVSGLQPLAARQFIRAAMQTMDVTDTKVLDRMHTIATRAQIVTAYSSMIVLVEQRQHKILDEAEKEANRFKRSTSSDEERLRQPSDVGVTGTPEPHEWVLILLGVGFLMYRYRTRLKLSVSYPIV